MEKLTVIGGSKYWGSGKVIANLRNYAARLPFDIEFIETQGARFEIFSKLNKIPNGSAVLFQPSICFPAFIRDFAILEVLKNKSVRIYFLLLVDLQFKNVLFLSKIFRNYFFGNWLVFGSATPSLKVNRFKPLPPFFEKTHLTENIVSLYCEKVHFIHFGYRSKIKGWDDFVRIAKANSKNSHFVYIGKDKLSANEKGHIVVKNAKDTIGIENIILREFDKCFPVFLFCSKFDFSPLMVLECGWWGVPICVIKNSNSSQILSRFIPNNCFLEIEDCSGINFNFIQARNVASNLRNYLENCDEQSFFVQLFANVDCN